MFDLVLGAFALWVVWEVAARFLEADLWIWRVILVAAGVGWAVLLHDHWWLGIGVGGVAAFLGLLADLILLATDFLRVQVLKKVPR